MTKSDDGERTCPLCAEEMDLTDQQLKPCKCGYEICVWCWHHIMEMAEKDSVEGRCPACRSAYDKERIVGMAATTNCGRLINEVNNTDKRMKGQKGKLKISAEARKQLGDVRVIQRNLVYVVGMPPSVADVHILERKEYFGQYGKILKISISRAGNGAQQSTSSIAVSVYITYAREEEAVRCILAVNSFVLEGKPLRACFGTTKYCHSWIRNTTCSNPDCYYLHDICNQEDSFMKNEIISAYTRLPQFGTNSSRCRAGNILPPPADDVCTLNGVSSTKVSATSALSQKGSPPKGSGTVVRSTVLPSTTPWGSRPSGSASASLSYFQGKKGEKQEVTCLKKSRSHELQKPNVGKEPDKIQEWLEDGIGRASESCNVTGRDGHSQDRVLRMSSYDASLSSAWHDDTACTTSRTTEDSFTTDSSCTSRFSEPKDKNLSERNSTLFESVVDGDTTQHVSSAWDDDDYEDDILGHKSLFELPLSTRSKPPITSSTLGQEQGIQLPDEAFENVSDKASTPRIIATTPCTSCSSGCIEDANVPGVRIKPPITFSSTLVQEQEIQLQDGAFENALDIASTQRIIATTPCTSYSSGCIENANVPVARSKPAITPSSYLVQENWTQLPDKAFENALDKTSTPQIIAATQCASCSSGCIEKANVPGSRSKLPITSSSTLVQEQWRQFWDEASENVLDKASTPQIISTTVTTPCISCSSGCIENANVPGKMTGPSVNVAFHEETAPTFMIRSRLHDSIAASDNMGGSGLRLSSVNLDGQYWRSADENSVQNFDSDNCVVENASNLKSRFQTSQCQSDPLDFSTLSIASALTEDAYVLGAITNLTSEPDNQALRPLDNPTSCLMSDNCSSDASIHLCGVNATTNCLSGSLRHTDNRRGEACHVQNDRDFFLANRNDAEKFSCMYNQGNMEDKPSAGISIKDGSDGIISNALSMDFDPWSDPLSSNNSFIKLLRHTGVQRDHMYIPSSTKSQSINQSRFSFARQEEQVSVGLTASRSSAFQDPFMDDSHHGATTSSLAQSIPTLVGNSTMPPFDRSPVFSRAKVSAPPGFSVQTRAPPPGFSYQNTANQIYGRGSSDVHISQGSSLGNPVQLPEQVYPGDVEFIDPAILAVVRGSCSQTTIPSELTLGSFPSTHAVPERDSRYQLLVNQLSLPQHPHRISEHTGDNFSHLNGNLPTWFGNPNFSSSPYIHRLFHASQDPYLSNRSWDGSSNLQSGNDLSIAEVSRRRLTQNSNLPGSENFKIHMVNPGSQFSQTFGL